MDVVRSNQKMTIELKETVSTKAALKVWIEQGRKPGEIPGDFNIERYLTPLGREKIGMEAMTRISELQNWDPEPWMFDQP